ncbi:hypothetical protein [Streptomyces violascens]|uniref:hypothetical protein n=1 Tax=Streptomyces violascens TaxID=67381 RepID=UPI001672A2C4|nr:hypothetical protein [Streptomyces violascens]GGU30129.1 hypothetical protein GCM10010289_59440 [Streptomyces violascens]
MGVVEPGGVGQSLNAGADQLAAEIARLGKPAGGAVDAPDECSQKPGLVGVGLCFVFGVGFAFRLFLFGRFLVGRDVADRLPIEAVERAIQRVRVDDDRTEGGGEVLVGAPHGRVEASSSSDESM